MERATTAAVPTWARLVPELLVADLAASLAFWRDLIGFRLAYARPEEGFAYLDLDGAQVMLEEVRAGARQWVPAPLDAPLGRGINLQIEVPSLDAILSRLDAAGWSLFMPREDAWYRQDGTEHGQAQALVQDPDGYLLRLAEVLGRRPA